jgi:hypothetical protein
MSPNMQSQLPANAQAMAPRVDPVDPSMIQAMRQYTTHMVNGYTLMKRDAAGNPTDVPTEHSFLFKIPASTTPADDGRRLGGASVVRATQAPVPAVSAPSKAGSGKLRELTD